MKDDALHNKVCLVQQGVPCTTRGALRSKGCLAQQGPLPSKGSHFPIFILVIVPISNQCVSDQSS
jgi:hypothetical protein